MKVLRIVWIQLLPSGGANGVGSVVPVGNAARFCMKVTGLVACFLALPPSSAPTREGFRGSDD